MKRDFQDSESGDEDEASSGSLQPLAVARKKRRGVIEKRRRDRINNSLSELRRMVPSAYEKQGSAKLEKAEILQLTVEHLKMLQNLMAKGGLPVNDAHSIAFDYRSVGYRECVSEVARYLVAIEGLDSQNPLPIRLLNHLQNILNQSEIVYPLKHTAGPGYPTWIDLATQVGNTNQRKPETNFQNGFGNMAPKSLPYSSISNYARTMSANHLRLEFANQIMGAAKVDGTKLSCLPVTYQSTCETPTNQSWTHSSTSPSSSIGGFNVARPLLQTASIFDTTQSRYQFRGLEAAEGLLGFSNAKHIATSKSKASTSSRKDDSNFTSTI